MVTNTSDTGLGSLRNAVSFAVEGDTIKFEIGINNSTILLSTPVTISEDIVLHNDYGSNVILGNKNSTNTSILLSIEGEVSIKGLKLESAPADAMKISVTSGGKLVTY